MSRSSPKIAYVVNSLNPGGTEKLVVEMSSAFRGDFDIEVFCLDEPGEWASDLRTQGIAVHCLWRQPGLDFGMAVKLARHFRRLRVDIVHAHQTTPWFYCALSRLIYSSPRLLFEEHGRFYPEVDKRARKLVNRLLISRLTHRCVAVSEDIRQRLDRFEGVDRRAIEVVYNGVRHVPLLSHSARRDLRSELGFTDAHFVVGTVGRFDPIKNLPLLVESIAVCARETESIRGVLVGDGPEFDRVRRLIAERGLTEKIHLTGFRTDARRVIQCLDLFVLSSFSEGTSMALLEAMNSGVPVAVTAVGGNPEVVGSPSCGWVVPSDSLSDMVASIQEAIDDGDMRQRFARAAKARFAERFSLEAMLSRYREIYAQMWSPDDAFRFRGPSKGA